MGFPYTLMIAFSHFCVFCDEWRDLFIFILFKTNFYVVSKKIIRCEYLEIFYWHLVFLKLFRYLEWLRFIHFYDFEFFSGHPVWNSWMSNCVYYSILEKSFVSNFHTLPLGHPVWNSEHYYGLGEVTTLRLVSNSCLGEKSNSYWDTLYTILNHHLL